MATKNPKRDSNGRLLPKGASGSPAGSLVIAPPDAKPAALKDASSTDARPVKKTLVKASLGDKGSSSGVIAPKSFWGPDGELSLPKEDWGKTSWKDSEANRITGAILSPSYYRDRFEALSANRMGYNMAGFGSSPAERQRAMQKSETEARKALHAERLTAEKARNDAYYEKWKADNAARRTSKLVESKENAKDVASAKVMEAITSGLGKPEEPQTPLNRSDRNPRTVSTASKEMAEKVLPPSPGGTPQERDNATTALGLLLDGNADKVPGKGQPVTYGEAQVEGASGGKPLPETATDQDKIRAYGESVLPVLRLPGIPAAPAGSGTSANGTQSSVNGPSYRVNKDGSVSENEPWNNADLAAKLTFSDFRGGHSSLGSDGRYHRFSLLHADDQGGQSGTPLYNKDKSLTAAGQKVYDETLAEAKRSAGSGRTRIWINGKEVNPQDRAYKVSPDKNVTSSKSSPGTEYHFTDKQEAESGVRLKGASSWEMAPGVYEVGGHARTKDPGTVGTYSYSQKDRERFGKEGYGGIDANGDAKKQSLDAAGWKDRWNRLNEAAKSRGGVLEGSLTEDVRFVPTSEKGYAYAADKAMKSLFGTGYADEAKAVSAAIDAKFDKKVADDMASLAALRSRNARAAASERGRGARASAVASTGGFSTGKGMPMFVFHKPGDYAIKAATGAEQQAIDDFMRGTVYPFTPKDTPGSRNLPEASPRPVQPREYNPDFFRWKGNGLPGRGRRHMLASSGSRYSSDRTWSFSS